MMPLANGLLTKEQLELTPKDGECRYYMYPREEEPRFPLALNFCPTCGLVQLSHVVPGKFLYTDYPFLTASSKVMVEHFSDLMIENQEKYVPPNGLVVEIGSNDGSALNALRNKPCRVLGVDPAENIDTGDVPTERAFFNEETARRIVEANGQAHLIVACNVLAHVDDVQAFMRGIKALLHPDGAFVFEVPYLEDLLTRSEYDTLYHEHLSYFAIHTLQVLLEDQRMAIDDLKMFPEIHGGTIRCTAFSQGADALFDCGSGSAAQNISLNEMGWLFNHNIHAAFAREVESSRQKLTAKLGELRAAGKRIIAYGASAKGAIVLNYCGIGTDLVEFVIDNSPGKVGKFMPGTHQEIIREQFQNGDRRDTTCHLASADVVLLLAWNHREEIEGKLRAAGFKGKVITPHG